MKCTKCKKQDATHEHHIEFDPVTNKSNKDSDTINICARCHAKIHGHNVQLSDLRTNVVLFKKSQDLRKVVKNQERAFGHLELKVPQTFHDSIEQISEGEKKYVEEIKKILETKNKKQTNVKKLYDGFLKPVKGISHLLAGQLLGYMDISRFSTVSKIWKYCGMDVVDGKAPKRQKGKKMCWNPTMRQLCYNISDSFVKQRTPKYREIYDKEKEKQKQLILLEKYEDLTKDQKKIISSKDKLTSIRKMKPNKQLKSPGKETISNMQSIEPLSLPKHKTQSKDTLLEEGDHKSCDTQIEDVPSKDKLTSMSVVKPILLLKSQGKETTIVLQSNEGMSLPQSKLHVERRARRKAVKEFLKDYWVFAKNNGIINDIK